MVRCVVTVADTKLTAEINLNCIHFESVLADLDEASASLSTIANASQTYHKCLKDISVLYHPVSLITGMPCSPKLIMQEIYAVFGRLDDCSAIFRSEKIRKHIEKAKKVGKAMEETLGFVGKLVRDEVSKCDLNCSQQRQVYMRLIPAAYLDRVATQAKTAKERRRIEEIAEERREKALTSAALGALPQEKLDEILKLSKQLSGVFQRSSSCVEGRNGMLSQKFHFSRGFAMHQVEKFTCWANFVARRADNSTAAERLCGISQRDISKTTFERMNEIPQNRMAG
jgi:hypothetical protein